MATRGRRPPPRLRSATAPDTNPASALPTPTSEIARRAVPAIGLDNTLFNIELFWDEARGGYFNSRADDRSVIVRLKEDYDGAEPAPNSVAAMNLIRLDWMLGTPGARAKATATLEAFRVQWSSHPHALPQMLCAVELALEPPRTVVLAGAQSSAEVRALAHKAYAPSDVGAAIASGSFRTRGMIVAPCSIRTMAEIATGTTSSALTRAADVTLKERRPLVLMLRETPLHAGHLENLLRLARLGAIIAPPVPAFYIRPKSVAPSAFTK